MADSRTTLGTECMRSPSIRITAKRFDWHKLVFAHGWVFLAPYGWQEQSQLLSRPLRIASGASLPVAISYRSLTDGAKICAKVGCVSAVLTADRACLQKQIRRILQLDADFSEFHAACKGDRILGFVHRYKCGGLLRGGSAFEDVVKTVCTINCDWRNTKRMCEKLCLLDDGNFPTPGRVLALSEAELAAKTSCGYRARTIRRVAGSVADGKLPLDDWASAREFDRIRASLKDVWGIGPYALNHTLVLLGDYSTIPVDSEVLSYLRRVHFNGQEVSAKEAVKPYEQYGHFAYLAFKFGRMARRFNYIDK